MACSVPKRRPSFWIPFRVGREKTLRTCTAARRPAQVTFYDLSFCSLSGKVTGSGSWLCRQNLLSLGKVNGSRRASLAAPPAPQSSWAPGSQSRPSHGARPQTARAPLHRSPDHVGVLEGLQVPQHRHLADGRERHALLAGLHSHALQRHETASVLQVPGLEHLPIGALPDLRHAFVYCWSARLRPSFSMPPGRRPARRRWGGRGARSARSWPLLASSRTPGPLPRALELDLALSHPRRLPQSGARTLAAAGAGWSDLPAGGHNPGAAAAKLRLPSRRGASRSLLFPPRSSVLCIQAPRRLHSLCPSASHSTVLPPKRGDGRTRRKCNQTSQAPSSGFL